MDSCTWRSNGWTEAGKPADFTYPEYELKDEQKVGTARLEAELLVMEDQVNSLDIENMKLRKALRNAGSFGGRVLSSQA